MWFDTQPVAALRVYRLTLFTLAGNAIQVAAPVGIHHNWQMLEDFLVERLPAVSQLDTEVDLLCPQTQEALTDPIQDALRNTRTST